jgi:hypothetical protein
MNKLLKTAVFVLMVGIARVACASAEVALNEMLQADFAGDSTSRQGRVHYSNGITMLGEDEGQVPRESWDMRWDSLTLVEAPGVVTCHAISRSAVRCVASVLALGDTQGDGFNEKLGTPLRHIVPLGKAQQRQITYQLLLRRGTWLVVDPPRPCVSPAALSTGFDKEIARATEQLPLTKENPVFFEKRKRNLAYLIAERARLEQLLPVDVEKASKAP